MYRQYRQRSATADAPSSQQPPEKDHKLPSRMDKAQLKEPIRKVRSAAPVTRANIEAYHRKLSETSSKSGYSTPGAHSPSTPSQAVSSPTTAAPQPHADAGALDRPETPIDEHAQNQSSIVDAIASTMIGEWMWKYMRRRSSFNMAEHHIHQRENGKLGDDGGGTKHRRWVWVAPYERVVMWSSKQPTSGSALLGKTGRKCKFDWIFPFFLCCSCLRQGMVSIGC